MSPGLRSFLPKPTLRLGGALEGLGEGLDTLKGGRGCLVVTDLRVEVLVVVVVVGFVVVVVIGPHERSARTKWRYKLIFYELYFIRNT